MVGHFGGFQNFGIINSNVNFLYLGSFHWTFIFKAELLNQRHKQV